MCPWREALATGSLAILIGLLGSSCSDSGGGPDAGGAPTDATTSGEATNEPSTEPTGPESSRPTRQQPSIDIASAPIGGNVDAKDGHRCAEVNWLGTNPIPSGTTINLGPPHLEPAGIFELDQTGCPADSRSCADVRWATSSFKACFVGARQVAPGSQDVSLIIPVTATCATESDCHSLVGNAGGSQIVFSPGEFSPTPSDG
jgi:hypothetical protein